MSASSVITQGFAAPGSAALVITEGFSQLANAPSPPTPSSGAGRRKRTRYLAKYKEEMYEFSTLRELQSFVYEAKKAQRFEDSPKQRKPKVVISLTPEYKEEVEEVFQFSDMKLPTFDLKDVRKAIENVKLIEAKMRAWQEETDEEEEEILKIIYDA